jgi:glutamine cyclotransferase
MPNGLQASEEGLWVIDQGTEELTLLDSRLQPIRTIPTPTENASGVTIGDGYFWTGSNAPATARWRRPKDTCVPSVLKCDMETGELVARYPTPDGGGIHGLEWVDGLLWITCFRPKALKLIDPKDFCVLKTIEVPFERLHGLAWDGEGLWCAHTSDKIIVKYNVDTGEVMDRIDYPRDAPAPHGLTLWNGDLWSCDANWPSPVHPQGPSFSRIVR